MEPGYPPQPPQYQPPGYPPPQYNPGEKPGNGMAVTSLVLGLIGLIFLQIILGPMAIIFGGIGIGRANKIGGTGKGMAIAGLVLGIFDILAFIVILAIALD